ncbi:hypothetical protein KAU33_05385 [Candidatus Dependentiae bacterium]|nr:hypothetical protein [Candidatus Dependentiae bacterium]
MNKRFIFIIMLFILLSVISFAENRNYNSDSKAEVIPYFPKVDSDIINLSKPNYNYTHGEYLEGIHLSNVFTVKDNYFRFNIQNLTRGSIPITNFKIICPGHVQITRNDIKGKFKKYGNIIKYTGKPILSKTGNIHFETTFKPVYDGLGQFIISFSTQIGIKQFEIRKSIPVIFRNGGPILSELIPFNNYDNQQLHLSVKIKRYPGSNFENFKMFNNEILNILYNAVRYNRRSNSFIKSEICKSAKDYIGIIRKNNILINDKTSAPKRSIVKKTIKKTPIEKKSEPREYTEPENTQSKTTNKSTRQRVQENLVWIILAEVVILALLKL